MPLRFSFDLLEWDSVFFGFPVARVREGLGLISCAEVAQLMSENGIELLYWGSPDRLPREWDLCYVGTQVTFEAAISQKLLTKSQDAELQIEPFPERRASKELRMLAYEAGWSSRFQCDARIAPSEFVRLYDTWIDRSCRGEIASAVFVAKIGEQVVGFVTLQSQDEVMQVGLIAIAATHRGRGIGSALLRYGGEYGVCDGCKILRMVTQANNKSAVRLCENLGMKLVRTRHWYHVWRDAIEYP